MPLLNLDNGKGLCYRVSEPEGGGEARETFVL